jgi:tetratricopeptide (TPR) repeat protein
MVNFWSQKAEEARARMDANALVEAVNIYRRALIEDGNDLILRLKAAQMFWETRIDAPAAIEQYRLYVGQTPNDYVRLAELANMERAAGDVNSALIHAVKAVEIMPTYALANYVTGVLYQIKGRPDLAQKYLAQTIRSRPDFEPGYTEAERVYRNGIESATEKIPLHLGLFTLLKEKGRLEEADKELQEAKSLDPNIIEPADTASAR